MKKLVIFLLMMFPLGLFAQESKIAIVNTAEVMQAMPEFADMQKQMQEMEANYQKELKVMSDEYNKKYADFRQITRQVTLDHRICSTESIYETAVSILDALELADRVRLVGVGVSGFEAGGPVQLSLMAEKRPEKNEGRRDRLNMAVDALRSRYGGDAVMRGRIFAHRAEGDPEEKERRVDRAEAKRLRDQH